MKREPGRIRDSDKRIARKIINSTIYAELFIREWKRKNKGTRKEAIAKLAEYGVSLARLKRKEKRLAAMEAALGNSN